MRRDTPRTIARVDRIDCGDLGIRQREIDDVDVLGQPLTSHRLREHDVALIEVPAQHDLRRGLAMGSRRVRDSGDREQVVLALSERTPGFDPDAASECPLDNLALLIGRSEERRVGKECRL